MRQQDRVLAALTRGPVCADTEWPPKYGMYPVQVVYTFIEVPWCGYDVGGGLMRMEER